MILFDNTFIPANATAAIEADRVHDAPIEVHLHHVGLNKGLGTGFHGSGISINSELIARFTFKGSSSRNRCTRLAEDGFCDIIFICELNDEGIAHCSSRFFIDQAAGIIVNNGRRTVIRGRNLVGSIFFTAKNKKGGQQKGIGRFHNSH